ncbi:leucine-rich repeat transmembrane neuronal protein 4-like [Mobula hypostoma]|uniref:leucine-rich repeat transmembrane neuronal protein 4-like n=1 Tax=Mobula hypostoma TaxID=723540 RepID=UPI002FC2E8E9
MGSTLVLYTVACFSNVASVDILVTSSTQCLQELNEPVTRDVSILNLSGLKLRRSYPDCLRYYSQLQVLLLNTSNLNTLDDTIFLNTSSIKQLYLQDNRLREFPSKPMVPLTQLQVLYVNNNYNKEIKSDAFQDLKELRQLHLGPQMQFQSFEYQALLPLKKVKVLVLKGLNLTFVPVINQMQLLQDLDLSDNKIDRVLAQYFYNLTKLRVLQLAGCRITFISKSAFSSQKNLRLLDLSRNGLITLSKETLSSIIQSAGGAVVILLAQNPFHCDASMCPMKKWLDTVKLHIQLDMMCSSPESLRGHWMTQLPLTKYNCVKEPNFALLPKASNVNKTAIAQSFLGKGPTGIVIVSAAVTSLLLISVIYLASAKLIQWSFLMKHCACRSAESTQQGKEEAATNSIRPQA